MGQHLLVLGAFMVLGWFGLVYSWPRIVLYVYKRAILGKGFGDGPIPLNTLRTAPQAMFADPIRAAGSAPNVATTGVNRDTLLTVGWLDLGPGPQVLHVPEMTDRYYAVQFTDPSNNTNFAYVGSRTTGAKAGDYLITGPGWNGNAPQGMAQIASPNNGVLVVGRVLVKDGADLATAHALSTEIRLTALARWIR